MSETATSTTSDTTQDPNAIATTTTTTAAQPAWSRDWLKEDGSLDHKAFEKAPDDFKPLAKDVERYKTFDEFLKGHRELTALAGKKGLVDPLPANASPKEIAERSALLRKVNGAPEDAKGYGLVRPEGVHETMWDQAYADSIAGIAHKYGISPVALRELAAAEVKYSQEAVESNKKQEAAWFESQDKLIRESAQKEGLDYAKAKDFADRAGRKFGVAADNPLMKNATVFMLLTRIGRLSSEDSLVVGDSGGIGDALRMNADQAGATAKDIQQNKENPDYKAYWNANDARHSVVVERVNAMLQLATKDKPRRTGGR